MPWTIKRTELICRYPPLVLEFFCLQLYAHGGKTLRKALKNGGGVRTVNRVAGSLMILVGAWLAFG